MIPDRFKWVIVLVLIIDLGYSFLQYYHTALDGDIAAIVYPSEEYKEVMSDPFGFGVILHHKNYAAPNRFFAHWATSLYFKSIPFLIQKFTAPVISLYASAALAKIVMHVALLLAIALLSLKITGISRSAMPLALMLTFPLFQANGYNGVMGVILQSITYSFFYSLPMALLLVYSLCLYTIETAGAEKRRNWIQHLFLVMLAVILAFNGPLIPGVVVVVTLLVSCSQFVAQYKRTAESSLSKRLWISLMRCFTPYMFHLIFFVTLSVYSIWLGSSNAENVVAWISLSERISRIPPALLQMFTNKLGLALLLAALIMNTILLRKFVHEDSARECQRLIKWVLVFSVIYIFLLPFGGYRWYRPDVVRFDTMLPVYIGMMIAFVASSLSLLRNLATSLGKIYSVTLAVILAIYLLADAPPWENNSCEHDALTHLAKARGGDVVTLDSSCTIMSWVIIRDPEYSRLNCDMLAYWNVTAPGVLYKQK